MRKRVVLMLVCLLLACCTGATLSAFAGINTNSPVGDSLMANGKLNEEKFIALDDDETAPAIEVRASDYSVQYNEGEWQEMLVGTPVPKTLMAKQNVKVRLNYKITGLPGTTTGAQLKIVPGASALTEAHTYGYVLTGNNNGIVRVGAERTAATASDPASKLITHHGGDAEFDFGASVEAVPWQVYSWSCSFLGGYVTDYGAAYFGIEMTVNANNWVDVKLERGIMQNGSMSWVKGTTVTNWAPYNGQNDFYTNVWTRYATGMIVDGATLTVTYDEGGETKTETLFDTNMDDQTKVITAADAAPAAGCYIARGLAYNSFAAAEIRVTNPAKDARIATLNPLKVDIAMAKTFEMTVSYQLRQLAATRKVGIAFGLKKYDTALSAPTEGASFLYFTVDADGNVVLGADNIAADGTATASGTQHTLAGAAVGSSAAAITLSVVGKSDNSIDVTIGDNTFNFPNMKLNGNLAFAQTGTGDVAYGILTEGFNVTGYELKENEATEVVSSTFSGNYFSDKKFKMQSIIAPTEFITKQDTTTHDITGLVAEDGQVGFYGTGTNSRLMFAQQYADFVLQFDYISKPFATRAIPAGISTANNPNRYSPLYIMFGAESEIPEFNQTYALGIIEGNATQYFWGAESLLALDAKLGKEVGYYAKPLSTVKTVEKSDEAIPCYRLVDGKFKIADYGMPNEDVASDPNFVYSFYNRVSRVKLVVINNNLALYAAPVANDGTAGTYVKLFDFTVSNSHGYVGFGTDAPGWAIIDNVAITPIAKSVALEKGLDAVPAVDLVADVAVSDMAADPEPTMLAKTTITVDAAAKKATWTAVTGAKEYEVVVTLNKTEKIKKTVTGTEIDLSTLTEAGEYTVAVSAIPEDEELYLKSRATATYTVEAASTPGDDTPPTPGDDTTKGGCGSTLSTFGGISAVVLLAGVGMFLKKRKENN